VVQNLPLDSVLSQLNPVYVFAYFFSHIHCTRGVHKYEHMMLGGRIEYI